MSRLAVFAYGSLVNLESAARTLERSVDGAVPARLEGWRRRWSEKRDNLTCEKTFARAGGGAPTWVLGLNVERDDDGNEPPNGLLIEVTSAELDRLDVREMRYDRVEVTERVARAPSSFDLVVTYTAKPAHFAPEPPPDSVVLATYARAIEAAFAELGERELRRYRETTGPPPVELIEPVLVRDRIPPGNPREW